MADAAIYIIIEINTCLLTVHYSEQSFYITENLKSISTTNMTSLILFTQYKPFRSEGCVKNCVSAAMLFSHDFLIDKKHNEKKDFIKINNAAGPFFFLLFFRVISGLNIFGCDSRQYHEPLQLKFKET
jgi:hypothetical protein